MRSWAFSCLLAMCIWPSMAMADVRVVVIFDEQGHRPHRIATAKDAISSLIQSHQQRALQPGANLARLAALQMGAKLIWRDQRGHTIKVEILQDPRFVHAPIEKDLSDRSWHDVAFREQGVYVLRGPQLAATVDIILPELRSTDRTLPAEKWILDIGSQQMPGGNSSLLSK